MRLPTPEFNVLLYGPGIPPAGVPARAHFEENVLVVKGHGHWLTIESSKLSLEIGGYDGHQWLITWKSRSGPVTVILQSDDAAKAFIEAAPSDISGELRRMHKSYVNRGRRYRLGLALLMLLPLLALVMFWTNGDKVKQWAAGRISLEREIRLGELAFEQMQPSLRLIEEDRVTDVVEFIGVRITGGSPYRFRFHVADDPRVDTFALPGGHIVIFTGLLRAARNAEELAGVLAHEASHVKSGHTLRNMIHGLGWRGVLAAALGDLPDGMLGGFWGDMSQELVKLSYSHDQELEADREAVQRLRRYGVAADGMADFFERLARAEGKTKKTMLARDPVSPERLAILREVIAREGDYPRQALQVDWSRMQQALARRTGGKRAGSL